MTMLMTGRRRDGRGHPIDGTGFAYDSDGRLAELICENVPAVDKVTLMNTGSEATSLAIRISRAVTNRQHIIVMQGGYNGNHDELACNVFNTLAEIGPIWGEAMQKHRDMTAAIYAPLIAASPKDGVTLTNYAMDKDLPPTTAS